MTTSASNVPNERRSESGDRARQLAGDMADKAAEYAQKAGSKIDETLEGATSVARAATQKGRQASAQAEEVASNFKQAVDKSLKQQPMTTLALAALAGVAIGALWKS